MIQNSVQVLNSKSKSVLIRVREFVYNNLKAERNKQIIVKLATPTYIKLPLQVCCLRLVDNYEYFAMNFLHIDV